MFTVVMWMMFVCFFFFQAEDGIRDLVRSRGLGDVYKRQVSCPFLMAMLLFGSLTSSAQYNYFDLPYGKNRSLLTFENFDNIVIIESIINLSLIHI